MSTSSQDVARLFFETNFTLYRVANPDGAPTGLVTGCSDLLAGLVKAR